VIRYLSAEQILFIHHRLITETGGMDGILDINLLISAASRPKATFDGNDLYVDLFDKAAALMDSLVRNHAFVDGNKRTAITATGLFLRVNAHELDVSNTEMVQLTLSCAQSQKTIEDISTWLKQHSKPL
jgi:death on curing protein